ncbi:hypothetical protein LSAT2_022664 [Lamellibrachia satsuma]|nr:hypothetical protein LSAT2_022664 [Lamellibrachia satsuma]
MEKDRSVSSRSSFRHGGWSRHGSSSLPDSEGATSVVTMLQPNEMLRNELVLHEAARKNSTDVVRKVIAEHVDVNSRNNSDRTALQLAAANGHVDTMKLLMDAEADKEASDKYGMNPLLWAASFGHLQALKLLVEKGVSATYANRPISSIDSYNMHNVQLLSMSGSIPFGIRLAFVFCSSALWRGSALRT